jgi:type I restriction enzyme, R subunit
MPETPEDRARKTIDDLLNKAAWLVQDRDKVNVNGGRGVAIRSFPLKSGHGFADYLLYVDGQAAGVIEAKKEGETLTTYEIQTAKYSEGLPEGLKAYRRPLPFCYQSTGVETRFTNLLDPDPRSRQVFTFHRPETLVCCANGVYRREPSVAHVRGQRSRVQRQSGRAAKRVNPQANLPGQPFDPTASGATSAGATPHRGRD